MTNPLRILIDGTETGQLSVLDRGLHYGEGVFRTLRISHGKLRHWPRHLARLAADAGQIGLAIPDPDALTAQAENLCADQPHGVLKIILTGGRLTGRGYRSGSAPSTCILLLYPPAEYPASCWQAGIRVRVCETRLAQNPRLAGIKHLNRLEQVLARAEWDDPALAEGLMLDTDDRLIEGVSSNLFLVRGGELLTPELSRCGVAGVMREMILEAAPAYTSGVRLLDLSLQDLRTADECLVCNSVIGIWPITCLENKRWDIGPVTRNLQRQLGEDACPQIA